MPCESNSNTVVKGHNSIRKNAFWSQSYETERLCSDIVALDI